MLLLSRRSLKVVVSTRGGHFTERVNSRRRRIHCRRCGWSICCGVRRQIFSWKTPCRLVSNAVVIVHLPRFVIHVGTPISRQLSTTRCKDSAGVITIWVCIHLRVFVNDATEFSRTFPCRLSCRGVMPVRSLMRCVPVFDPPLDLKRERK